jgi:hypothetical protein
LLRKVFSALLMVFSLSHYQQRLKPWSHVFGEISDVENGTANDEAVENA